MSPNEPDLEQEDKPFTSLILEVPVILVITSVTPSKEGEGYDVALSTMMSKVDCASLIHISRKHSVIGKLILTEGNLEAEQ